MSAVRRLKRRVDRALYALLHRAQRALFPSDAPRGQLAPAAVRRLLWLRHDAVGDMVVTTPALAYLRETLPHAELHVLASPRNAALLAGDRRVDRVLVHDPARRAGWWRTLRTLRAHDYDVVVDAVAPHHLREGIFTALVAGRRAARVSPRRAKRYAGFFTHAPRPLATRPQAERLLHLAQSAVGDAPPPRHVDLARWPMALAPSAAAEARAAAEVAAMRDAAGGGPLVAVNAWSADPRRSLAPALVAEVVAELARRHPTAAFVLTPPRGAMGAARAIVDDAARRHPAGERVHVVDADLPTLVALLRRAALLVSPDTANVHVAGAVGTPVVALFVRHLASARQWGPVGVPSRVVELCDGRELPAITAREVLDAVEALWAEPGVRQRAAEAPRAPDATRPRGLASA